MKKALIIAAAVIVLTPAALALLGVVLGHERTTTHTVTGSVREIVVNSDSGDVHLVGAGAGSDAVQVRETQHYVLKRPTLEQDVTDGRLTLKADCGSTFFNCSTDLRVTVPAGVKITVAADSGDVHAEGVDVPQARAESDSGDVHLELAGRQSLAWAHTDSGDVHVTTTAAREIDARTDSGDVDVEAGDAPSRVVAVTDSGDVGVRAPAGEYAVDTETDSGDVEIGRGISRNDRAGRSIEARTDSGDVTLHGG